MDLRDYIPKGELEYFPKEVISKMLEHQVAQGNPEDIKVFEKHAAADSIDKGFTWSSSPEGQRFWNNVIHRSNFDSFFAEYPKASSKVDTGFDLDNYKPKGKLDGFPKEVIKKMLKHQVKQGNKEDVEVFETRITADDEDGGFTWSDTEEGSDFWNLVIEEEDFDYFFEKYPKSGKEFDLDTYVPKGQLENIPVKIIDMMLKHQVKQGNKKDVTVFEKNITAGKGEGGFTWSDTNEGHDVWYKVSRRHFEPFYDYYAKH